MEEKREIKQMLYTKYNSLVFSRDQVAEILNISVATLDRWRSRGLYLDFKKVGDAKNSIVQYSLSTVADYICDFQNVYRGEK